QAISPKVSFDYRVHYSLSKSTGIDSYRIAFEKYIQFLSHYQESNPTIGEIIKRDSVIFLQYFCRSLSHRLLKSNTIKRLKVGRCLKDCRRYAKWLGIANPFHPHSSALAILAAALIDSNQITRDSYTKIRNLISKSYSS